MTEYSRMAKGSYTVSGGTLGVSAPSAKIINLPFKPDYVELINLTQAVTPAQHGIPFAFWDASATPITVSSVQYDTIVQIFNATPVLTTDSVRVGGGISVFSAGQMLQFGPVYKHNSVASADFSIAQSGAGGPTTVTTATAHGLSSGDVIIFEGLFQSSTTGMPQLNGIPFTVTVLTSTTFTIPWDTSGSNYTAFNSATNTGNIGAWKKVLYPYLYFPGVSFISAITLGTTTTIDTTDAHNFVVGQEVAFRIPNQWGTVELNSLPNTLVPGSPVYGYVIAVTDYNTVVVNINSSAMTAFNVNQTVASVPGLSYPQIVAVGDVNTGGVQLSSGSALYPPPYYSPIGTTRVNTINGPAIQGAFVNNTSQGFIIGNAASRTDTSSWVGGSNGDIMEYRAYSHDISSP
jgi:Ubiquitin-activating enzyme E1 FCCH domain